VVGTDGKVFQMPPLPVPTDVGAEGHELIDPVPQLGFSIPFREVAFPAQFQCPIAIGTGFQKKDRRQQVVALENPQDVPKGRQPVGGGELQGTPAVEIGAHLFIKFPFFSGALLNRQREQRPRGM